MLSQKRQSKMIIKLIDCPNFLKLLNTNKIDFVEFYLLGKLKKQAYFQKSIKKK